MKLARCVGVLFGLATLMSAAEPEVIAVKTGRFIDPRAGAVIPQDFADKQPEGDEIQRQNFKKAVQAGVKIAFGTDASVYPHGFNARQFSWHVKYGQMPMEAIRSATVAASDLIGRNNNAGSLEPGKWADLIAVKGDPLADIRVLENVSFVMKEGRVYKDAR
jgi:imidazolonepropionase-like amidohydrolase